MNERIRELAEQSGYGARWTTTEQFEGFMEKFAELIIRECVQVCKSVDEADIQFRYDYRRGALDGADAIRQHFGVQ